MTGSIGDLVAQLLAVRRSLDEAAVTALRAQADAAQASAHLEEVRRGSNDAKLRMAALEAETARAKAGRYARLLAVAADHIGAYVTTIAPGSDLSAPDEASSPSGDRVVREAGERTGRAEAFIRRHVKKADDTEDTLKQSEQAVTTGLRELEKILKGSGAGSSTTSTSSHPATPVDRPQLEHPVTSVIMAAGAVVVGVRGAWDMLKKRRERKRSDDQPRDDRLHPDDGEGRPRRE
ncbi:hypothetical protein E1091_02830 [Micromonospora fluostatini]|uniref:DUF3618 domain-containing protein n=1 Tax=Micromonospora fluostatini TaxID=1629071 RepID=A0ABY2DKQ5_9ACTN|nr:hypothetical protein E1091_02830 [Micromonospora fluostatini]